MKRREFLTAAAMLAMPAVGVSVTMAAESKGSAGLIEVRTYHFASAAKKQAYAQFLTDVGIAAYGRAGVAPVGAFRLLAKDNPDLKLTEDSTDLYLVLGHKSFESAMDLPNRLNGDKDLQSRGGAILNADKKDPAFTRYESSLLQPFASFPNIETPTKAPGRIAQLRIYESHSEERAVAKVRMFEDGGEIAIFKKSGLTPVFFGKAVAGPILPNLHYMVIFENEQAQEKAWAAFKEHPEWKTLSKDAQYKNTVSHITNLVLRPIEGSQL